MWKKISLWLVSLLLVVSCFSQSKGLEQATAASSPLLSIRRIGAVVASDEDVGQFLIYTIVPNVGEPKPFSIGPLSGIVYMKRSYISKVTSETIYNFKVEVRDNGVPSLANYASVTVRVKNDVLVVNGVEVPTPGWKMIYLTCAPW